MSSDVYKASAILVMLGLLAVLIAITMGAMLHRLAFANAENEYLTRQVYNLMHQCDCREERRHDQRQRNQK
jgi:hypothetical protein